MYQPTPGGKDALEAAHHSVLSMDVDRLQRQETIHSILLQYSLPHKE